MAKSQLIDRDRGWKALKDGVGKLGPIAVKVGVLEDAGMHQTAGDGEPLTVAEVAAVNEYGSSDGRIPERPAWRNALDGSKDKIVQSLQVAAGELLDGAGVEAALGKPGLLGQATIRRGIDALVNPPNAPLTIARKGSSKPLIDSAQTRNAVTYEIIQGGAVKEARGRGVR